MFVTRRHHDPGPRCNPGRTLTRPSTTVLRIPRTVVLVLCTLSVVLIAGCRGDDVTTVGGCAIEPGAQCRGSYMAGGAMADADLFGADLSYADLSGAELRRANLTGATMRQANLRGADLQGAELANVDLNRADLRGARLEGADLRGASLVNALVSRVQLSRATVCRTDLGAIVLDVDC
jgi:uncharacterized protein YjbI with pentapeptide repeats